MKLEIGGGGPTKQRGDGWVNLDHCETADVRHDLNQYPWPFADESVEAVYSSHCLEHLKDPMRVLHEVARICQIGASVEIRVPHPISDLAMVYDHVSVFSPIAVLNADETHYHARDCWEHAGPRRLKLQKITYGSSILLEEAKRELPFLAGLSDEVIMKWIPRTCHECVFYYEVAVNEFNVVLKEPLPSSVA